MKTKIIYISGNEIFDMTDIRAAFNEVRAALNLDKDTVLFGVPIDEDDAGLSTTNETKPMMVDNEIPGVDESMAVQGIDESVVEKPEKKRSRSKKTTTEFDETPAAPQETSNPTDSDEKVVPILSVLSTKESDDDAQQPEQNDDIEIIEDITQETSIITDSEPDTEEEITENNEVADSDEPDLEKLLSEMKPLNEDILEEQTSTVSEPAVEDESENIDATLEKLATEFVQTQDKIASNTKSGSRSKIGKLRNILPFKQSKHHDQGLGDLFGWAGVAANDEEFSVPGFFTTASSKK